MREPTAVAAPCRYQRCWAAHRLRLIETRNLLRHTTLLQHRRLVLVLSMRPQCTLRRACLQPPQTILPSDDRKPPIIKDHTTPEILEPLRGAVTRLPGFNATALPRPSIRDIPLHLGTLAGCLMDHPRDPAANQKFTLGCLLDRWIWVEALCPKKVMVAGKTWAGPAPQWSTTLREVACDPIHTMIDTGLNVSEEKQSNASEREGSGHIQEATQGDTQCTTVTMVIVSLRETQRHTADRLMRATRETHETLEICATLEIQETLEITETPATLETRVTLTGDVKAPTQPTGPRWTTSDRTRIILLPPVRTHRTAPRTRLRPPNAILQSPIHHLPNRMRPPVPRNPTSLPIALE